MDKNVVDTLALTLNGLFMITAVYFPRVFGDGVWSRFVFTINFIAVMVAFYSLVSRGVL